MNSGDSFFSNIFSNVIKTHKQFPDTILYGAAKNWCKDKFCGVSGESAETLDKAMIPHNAAFVPLSVYLKYGCYDETYTVLADYDAFLRFYVNKVPFKFLDSIICNYELDGISMKSNLVGVESESIHKKYGFYTPPSMKKRIVKILKKILHW